MKGNEGYDKYLKSNQWALKKEALFKSRGRACEKCGSLKNIQVHHRTYERIFNEKLSDLEVLCGKCHRKTHGILITENEYSEKPKKKKSKMSMKGYYHGHKWSRKDKSLQKRINKLKARGIIYAI